MNVDINIAFINAPMIAAIISRVREKYVPYRRIDVD